MTTLLATRPNPFVDAECRRPGRNQRWWDVGASRGDRAAAAVFCAGCPAFEACARQAEQLGAAATGTWAGIYRKWVPTAEVDGDALAEFLAVFGPSSASHDNPPPTVAAQSPKPVRQGRYWIHPSQLTIEYQEAK